MPDLLTFALTFNNMSETDLQSFFFAQPVSD